MSETLSGRQSSTSQPTTQYNHVSYLLIIAIVTAALSVYFSRTDHHAAQSKSQLMATWVSAGFISSCILLSLYLKIYSKLQIVLCTIGLFLIAVCSFKYLYFEGDINQTSGIIAGASLCFLAEYMSRSNRSRKHAGD